MTADERADNAAIGVDGFPPAAFKVEDADLVALKIEEHLALRAHDVGLSAIVVEAAHGEGRCGFVGKLHIHDLVIDHVVVALKDALAVLRMAQRVSDILVGGIDLAGRRRAEPHVALVVQIQLDGVIGAGLRVRAAVDTALRRISRGVFTPEVLERTERLDLRAFLLHQPLQQVDVVAGLGQQHEIAFGRVAPVAADKAVALVNVSQSLCVDDRDDVAQNALVNELFDAGIERRVAQHMADHEFAAVFSRLLTQLDAFFLRACKRLFQQHIITGRQRLHGRCIVHAVLRCNDRKIGQLRLRQQLLPCGQIGIVRAIHPVQQRIALHPIPVVLQLHQPVCVRRVDGIDGGPAGRVTEIIAAEREMLAPGSMGNAPQEYMVAHRLRPDLRPARHRLAEAGKAHARVLADIVCEFRIHRQDIALLISRHTRRSG